MKFPVQIQADNMQADDAMCPTMCHVFDLKGLITISAALQKQYLHVIAWDAEGEMIQQYDNRA